ncbi:MAG: fimbrillin family protein [Lepagella sp.]
MFRTFCLFKYLRSLFSPFISFSAVALVAASLSSCHDDLKVPGNEDGHVGFEITTQSFQDGDARSTRCDSVASISVPMGGEALPISLSESPNRDLPFNNTPTTRSTPVEDSNVSSLIISAYDAESWAPFMSAESVNVSGGNATASHFWPNGRALSFFAFATSLSDYNPNPSYYKQDGKLYGSFSNYTVPTQNGSDGARDAEAQPDFVFAMSPNRTRNDGTVPLTMHHALTAVRFRIGQLPQDAVVNTITISGLYGKGSCVFQEDATLGIAFDWSYGDDTATHTYSQTFNHTKSTTEGVETLGGSECTFMLLPQTISDATMLTINVTYPSGLTHEISTPLKNISTVWNADTKYTYTIGVLPEEVDVSVDDTVNGNVKSDLKVRNTGISDGYIRVAVIGCWTNLAGDVVASWQDTDGAFAGLMGANWVKGDDGFYYYTQVVQPGALTATPLFDTYTLTANPPVSGAQLELSIIAQIVPTEKLSEAWPGKPF